MRAEGPAVPPALLTEWDKQGFRRGAAALPPLESQGGEATQVPHKGESFLVVTPMRPPGWASLGGRLDSCTVEVCALLGSQGQKCQQVTNWQP